MTDNEDRPDHVKLGLFQVVHKPGPWKFTPLPEPTAEEQARLAMRYLGSKYSEQETDPEES